MRIMKTALLQLIIINHGAHQQIINRFELCVSDWEMISSAQPLLTDVEERA